MTSLKGRSEWSVAAFLGAVAVVVAIDAITLPTGLTQVGPVGPRVVPLIVAGLLATCAALLARDVKRGGHGDIADGEDIDLTIPSDWRTPGLLVAAFAANAMLIERIGWVFSGALLFWLSSYALGSPHPKRDIVISFALSITTFYAFYSGLGIPLPAGPLEGIL
ncbi:MAG: tripartite tricarboxylate transporter TctB family protein [Angustibacter sp.]